MTAAAAVRWWLLVLVALACCCSTALRVTVHCAAATATATTSPASRVPADLLRLKPSNDPGFIADLLETPNPALDPRPADVNVTALLAKLGAKFDPDYMSVTTPGRLVPVASVSFRRNRRGRLVPAGEMPAEMRALDTKYFTLPDGRRLRTRISGQLRRKIQQYLWGRTMCPVQRRWKDLGQRFWPRWLLEGHCVKGEQSCSVPAGMYCRATGSQYKTLLRWHCRAGPSPAATALQWYNSLQPGAKAARQVVVGGAGGQAGAAASVAGGGGGGRMCQWIKVEYPVVTECGCSCAPDRDRDVSE